MNGIPGPGTQTNQFIRPVWSRSFELKYSTKKLQAFKQTRKRVKYNANVEVGGYCQCGPGRKWLGQHLSTAERGLQMFDLIQFKSITANSLIQG